jgi:hypothetical protein
VFDVLAFCPTFTKTKLLSFPFFLTVSSQVMTAAVDRAVLSTVLAPVAMEDNMATAAWVAATTMAPATMEAPVVTMEAPVVMMVATAAKGQNMSLSL